MSIPIYLSDLNLPKELSKKKKLNLIFGKFIESPEKIDTYEFEMSKEDQLVFFTVEGAITHEIMTLSGAILNLSSGNTDFARASQVVNTWDSDNLLDLIMHGVMVLVNIEISAQALNDRPIRVDVRNNPIDPEYDETALSMHFSTVNKNPSDYAMHISFIQVDQCDIKMGKDNNKIIDTLKFHQIVHTA